MGYSHVYSVEFAVGLEQRQVDFDRVVPHDWTLRVSVFLEIDQTEPFEFCEVPVDLSDVTVDETSRFADPVWFFTCDRPGRNFRVGSSTSGKLFRILIVLKKTYSEVYGNNHKHSLDE